MIALRGEAEMGKGGGRRGGGGWGDLLCEMVSLSHYLTIQAYTYVLYNCILVLYIFIALGTIYKP